MTIKHLVISGGGPILFQITSAIQELERKEYLNMKNIESIYGTSAGGMIGVILCCKHDWTNCIQQYIC
jgi:predicted acylesterase/phospholipase RssA